MSLNISKDKSKAVLILLIMIVVLTSFRLLWLNYHTPAEQPFAKNGMLDLRGFTLDEDSITLDGEWVFYPEQLVEPNKLNLARDNEIRSIGKNLDKKDGEPFGTYHLKIQLDEASDSDAVYSIQIPSINTATALFVNGNLKGNSGVVATTPEHHIGKGSPYIASFSAEKGEIDLVLHVSNFDTMKGISIAKPLQFSYTEVIAKEQSFAQILLISMVTILFLHSIYSLLIYILIHRDKIFLFFTLGFTFPAIDELVTYSNATFDWLQLNYAWSFKLREFIYLAAPFFLVQLMRMLLTNYKQYKRFRWFTIAYGIGAALIILLPIQAIMQVDVLFFSLYFVSFLSVITLALKEYFQFKDESFLIAIVVVSTTSGIVWGLIKDVHGLQIPFYPFDYLCAFLGFAVFWFKRFYRQNRQVVELVDELKRADQLKDEFLVESTDKLWSPLNKMTTIAQTLFDRKQSSFTYRDRSDLNYLINIGRGMSYVLYDLLDFTRLKEHMIQVHPKNASIQAVIAGVFDLVKHLADGKQVELVSTVPPQFPRVLADESRLNQICFNLIETVIANTGAGKVTVHAEVCNQMAIIYVRDNGEIANKQEQLNRDAFGLRLDVSRQLIELHGGRLAIKSEADKETVFTFSLPLSHDQDNEDDEESAYEQIVEDNQTQFSVDLIHILIVDDDPGSLRVIEGLFPAELYNVVTVMSGKEALPLIHALEWDLIIIDGLMPYMSGYELTKWIRKRYTLLELPILLLTSRGAMTEINVAFTIGANDYVIKPINAVELKSRSVALIDLKKSIIERHAMESAWLQAQIRPHFLFNTLNTIASLSQIDPDRMIRLLDTFGKYLYRSFKEDNLQQLIPIQDELELVKSYVYIEKERFGDRLQVEWNIDKSIHIKVPPLSIQTLVENAVQHGVLKKRKSGTVWIRVTDEETHARIAIVDDGIGMDAEKVNNLLDAQRKSGAGIGLPNTNNRIKRIFGSGLTIKSLPRKGTTVEFIVPKDLDASPKI
ncbi:hypothetical protein BEP19_02890 [Ammoniphilus oxalaticus]|uniref:Histidine kinase n=1 Tax=Ammoniphilus oxalaticus TaxID=66863 RepID=A0A419SNU9_9BACL|nr:ATP-binding protein [Ammoniphilus oxalaticus]RKD25891.1 hypothetical protein BEP19_02890 [Ammoniphilus oxalaticus]